MMQINHTQAKALAAYLNTIRNDWGIEGCITAIGQARDQGSIEDITRWSVAAALNPSNRGPAVIPMPGPHRAPPALGAPAREPFDRETYCGTCSEPRDRCERLWAGDHTFESVARATARAAEDPHADARAAALDYARQAIGDAKAEGITPPPERAHKPNEHVEELRAMVPAAEPTDECLPDERTAR